MLVSGVQQSESAVSIYIYTHTPSFFGFLSHLGHHRALSRLPCAAQLKSFFTTKRTELVQLNACMVD